MIEEIVLSYMNDKEKMIDYAKQYSGLEEAEDIVQDAYLRLIKNKDGLNDKNQINSRLHYYIKCNIHERFKETGNEELKIKQIEKNYIKVKSNESEDPLQTIIDRHEEVNELIHKLPLFYRVIMELVSEGYEYDEISEGLGVNPSSLRTRIERGRKLVKKEYYKRKEMF